MKPIQIAFFLVIAVFYTAYFSKIVLQRKNGIRTDQIGKGSKQQKVLLIEKLMKLATYLIVPVEILCCLLGYGLQDSPTGWVGIGVAFLGVCIFITAMITMRDNWRAGIPTNDETKLITSGLYRISRNPAFLGFDLMYLGLLIVCFHFIHFLFALFPIVMLHLQILQEEKFLSSQFGEEYAQYKKRVGRYFIL